MAASGLAPRLIFLSLIKQKLITLNPDKMYGHFQAPGPTKA